MFFWCQRFFKDAKRESFVFFLFLRGRILKDIFLCFKELFETCRESLEMSKQQASLFYSLYFQRHRQTVYLLERWVGVHFFCAFFVECLVFEKVRRWSLTEYHLCELLLWIVILFDAVAIISHNLKYLCRNFSFHRYFGDCIYFLIRKAIGERAVSMRSWKFPPFSRYSSGLAGSIYDNNSYLSPLFWEAQEKLELLVLLLHHYQSRGISCGWDAWESWCVFRLVRSRNSDCLEKTWSM